MPVRVLCTGDIHIGRQTSKIRFPYRTADAWMAVVDLAIEEQVDLLAISGDLIDKEGNSYESLGPLAHGLGRLATAGIETVAITGNHDWNVLPRVARLPGLEHFHVIGASAAGEWRRHTVLRNDRPVLHVDGWSFPAEHVLEGPMLAYPRAEPDDVAVLGMLHCDVGSLSSKYAPALLNQFWGHDPKFWLLGHIHVPAFHAGPGEAGVLYPGSPYAMDPGEPGIHGAWLLTIDANGYEPPRQIPMSPVQYETVPIDTSEVTDESGFQAVTLTAMTAAGQRAIADHPGGHLREVSLRLQFTGACAEHESIPTWANRVRQDMAPILVESITVSLDTTRVAVTPPVNLVSLAAGRDPAAETARLLIALDEPELPPEYEDLLRKAEASLKTIAADSNFAAMERDESIETRARTLLKDQGWNLLSALIATKESA